MGVIGSRLTKPLRSFNIENRAQKILNREKPIPAPSHPSTSKQLKVTEKVNPNFLEDHNKKDVQLDERLKHIFVSSQTQVDTNDKKSEKQLPSQRKMVDTFDYGFWEPDELDAGRAHLKTILKFLADHVTKSDVHTAEAIALQYKLDLKDVEKILKYYKVYQYVKNTSNREKNVVRKNIRVDCIDEPFRPM